jgi:hypothetical protein
MKPIASILVALSIPLFFDAGLAQDLTKAKQEGRIVFDTSWGPSDADYVVKASRKDMRRSESKPCAPAASAL